MGEHATSARDGEDHAAQFAQKAVPHFDRDSRAAPHFGKEFEQAKLAVRGQLNGLANGIDEPAEDNFKGAPTGVALEKFLQGDDFATAVGVGRVIGAEGFIDCVEEDSTDSIGTSRATLGEGNEVVNIDIGRRKGGSGSGGGRWRGMRLDKGGKKWREGRP